MCGERGVFVLPISYGMTKCQASFGDRGMFRWYRQVSTCPPLLPACFGIKTLGIVSIVILPRSGAAGTTRQFMCSCLTSVVHDFTGRRGPMAA